MEPTVLGIYCERTGPGLLAEPLNAVSNASFIIAAWAAWRLAGGWGRLSAGLRTLLALSTSVGIGSGLWHTLATPWAMILDVVPIFLFIAWFLWLYARNVMRMPTPVAVASMAGFVAVSSYAQGLGDLLNDSIAYAPAFLAVLALGVFHARHRAAARYALLAAAAAYALALGFRAIDQEVCSTLPIGTHFLWHSLTGLTAYLAMRTMVLNRAPHEAAGGASRVTVPA